MPQSIHGERSPKVKPRVGAYFRPGVTSPGLPTPNDEWGFMGGRQNVPICMVNDCGGALVINRKGMGLETGDLTFP